MNKIRFAVVGLGIGAFHIKGILENVDAELVAICDTNEEILKKALEEYRCPIGCIDYRELLNRNDIDAVCVCSPDHLHRDMVIDFLKAGKHVLCEKPLAITDEDCEAMIAAADASDVKFMVGQVARMTPAFIYAKQIVEDGVLGELFFVESEYAHDYSGMKDSWRKDPTHPRHPITGGGCHAVDLLRWIAGNPTEVYGMTTKKVLTDWPCDDSGVALLKFPNNVMGKVFVSTGCKRNYTMRTVLYGTEGTLICDNTNSYVSLFKENFFGTTECYDHTMENVEMRMSMEVNNHNMPAEIDQFCKAIRGDDKFLIPAREGAHTVAVCNAIIESAATGLPVKVKYI